MFLTLWLPRDVLKRHGISVLLVPHDVLRRHIPYVHISSGTGRLLV